LESDGRESYLRAIISHENGRLVVRLTGPQGSGNIFSLVRANALLIVPSGVKSLPANSDVEIWPIA
jgi:molybdopterin molybdotransferase